MTKALFLGQLVLTNCLFIGVMLFLRYFFQPLMQINIWQPSPATPPSVLELIKAHVVMRDWSPCHSLK